MIGVGRRGCPALLTGSGVLCAEVLELLCVAAGGRRLVVRGGVRIGLRLVSARARVVLRCRLGRAGAAVGIWRGGGLGGVRLGRPRRRRRGGGGRLRGERRAGARHAQVDGLPGGGVVGDGRSATGGDGERERDERYGDEPLVREAQGATSSQLGSAAIRRPHVGQSLRSFCAG